MGGGEVRTLAGRGAGLNGWNIKKMRTGPPTSALAKSVAAIRFLQRWHAEFFADHRFELFAAGVVCDEEPFFVEQ